MNRGLTVALLLFIIVAASSSIWAPSPQGPAWNDETPTGHSLLVKALSANMPVRILESGTGVLPTEAGPQDTLFLFPTYREPSLVELLAAEGFVENGGTIILATDGGHGRQWMERFGMPLHGIPAVLPPGEQEPCITTTMNDGNRHTKLCLPSPSVLPDLPSPPDGEAYVLTGITDQPVFLDLDHNGRLTPRDQGPSTYPVVMGWTWGAGRIVAIADADLWRNGLLEQSDENLEFAFELLAPSGTVYIDSSGASPGAPIDTATARWTYALASPGILEGLAWAALLAGGLMLLLRSSTATPWVPHRLDLQEDPTAVARARAQLAAHPTSGSGTRRPPRPSTPKTSDDHADTDPDGR